MLWFERLSVLFLAVAVPVGARALPAVDRQPVDQPGAGDERAVREADRAFWAAFNRCDQAGMAERFAPDVEFYHDKTGLTQSRAVVTASMFSGPCADPAALRVRREAVTGTDHLHPLAGGFALLEGEHRFLATRPGGPERHDSIARYWEVWQRDAEAGWRMRRVVSFDHRPDEPVLAGTVLKPGERSRYLGRYTAGDGSQMTVFDDGGLKLRSGNATFTLVRLEAGRFGTPGRWLEFRFAGDTLTVVEEGKEVAHARRPHAAHR